MSSQTALMITGASGQLGRSFRDVTMPAHFTPHFFSRSDLDIADTTAVRKAIAETGASVVVNCAAYTKVDQAERDTDAARSANVYAVEQMARMCHEHDIVLIHISTDYVYDSSIRRPLTESDALNPESVYAQTKLDGEQAALRNNPKTVVIRTSWVFSEYGHNFVKTMVRLAKEGRKLRVVSDQIGCPTYARDLARAIVTVIEHMTDVTAPPFGIYNFSNAGVTSWHAFAAEIFRQAALDPHMAPVPTAEYVTAAKRPLYSVMDTSRFIQTFGFEPRPWEEALQECLPAIIRS